MRSLKVKLIVFVAVLMTILSAVIAGLVYSQMRSSIVSGVENELAGTANGYATFVKSWYDDKLQTVVAANPLANSPDPVPALGRMNEAAGFATTYVGFADHHIVYSDGHAQKAGYDPVKRPWYQQAVAMGKPGVSAPYVDFDTGKLCLTFVSPVMEGGNLKAVVGGDVFIDALVKAVLSIKLRGDGYAFLVDKTGNVIAHHNQQLTLKPLATVAPELTADKLNAAAASGDVLQTQLEGNDNYVKVVPIAGTDWLLGMAMGSSVVTEPMTKLLLTIVGIAVIALIVLVPIASFVLAGMLGGLKRLSQAMREISQGEGDLTRRIDVSGHDEIAETAHAFNTFVGHLQDMFRAVKEEADRVIEGVEEAGTTVRRVADDSREISDVSSSNAATLEQITVSISHIADAAQEADKLVNQTGSVSSDSAADMEKISREMGRTVDAVKGLSSMLETLDNRSQQITGITNVIKDIADQTNLLALNAAIEAARAGEMGRGFAVVADEVRKLAERTAQATLEITGMVNTIREETSQAVTNMQRTVSSVDGGVELTQNAVQRIEDIRAAMESVVAKMNEISLSTSEQHNATTVIAQSTERINGRIIDSDNSLQGVHQTLSVLSDAASKMREMFGRFRV
ncbi:methyl-accepting chemotaxis protein [Paludibacterium purpuratum]|uniref:Methyl-accepting chemotaxis sensory transducer with Cache sensor n=1 Tax=Paludibacterium purpuratum TaxID=1144873 RepID=A0A4R7B6H9_9NEIS|nr:methyl-accepting chemotaxis protein [Paludibacterium purpuratum]TDR80271.1 methyl-accepting chemotaxis sensory transducer with Cache sensor [Paludibacterium purpuratum]